MRHASSGAQFPDKKHKTWKVAAEKHQLQEKTPKNAGLLEPIYTRNKACQSWRAQCLSPTQLIQAPRSKRLPLKSQPNDVWTKRDKHLQTVSFFRSTFVSVSFGLTVHALPVASHSGRMKQVSDSVWFFFKWSCFKKPMCWCMKLWSFINDSFPLLSLSDSKGMSFLSEYVNTHSYFPSPFSVWTLSTSTATNTTARPKNPSAPLQLHAAMASCRWLSTMRRLRRCCAMRNGGRFRPPCCHSLTPPLLMKR